jgi:predicted SnoaL-like aldol condensation-catalyzing enzyme
MTMNKSTRQQLPGTTRVMPPPDRRRAGIPATSVHEEDHHPRPGIVREQIERSSNVNRKSIATAFLELGSSGKARQAFAKYVHPDFCHHNAYFEGDRESFLNAMEENAKQFPGKTYETLRALEDGDLVAIHGKVTFTADQQWSVIHIFRFEDGRIIESWEASQQALKDSPNQNGIF